MKLFVVFDENVYFCNANTLFTIVKSKELNTITFSKLLGERLMRAVKRTDLYEDKCLVLTDFDSSNYSIKDNFYSSPTRLDALIIFLCTEGEMNFTCDLEKIRLTPGMMFATRPGSIIQGNHETFCKGSVVIIDIRMLDIFNLSVQKILTHFAICGRMRGMMLSEDQQVKFRHLIEAMSHSFNQDVTNPYYHEVARSIILSLLYTILNYAADAIKEKRVEEVQVQGRNEDYFRVFIQLVKDNYREHRKINYYADRMCLTPKYLSTLIRKFSGKGPAEWIDMCVMLEAKNLLRYSDMSIQEIAFELGFPTQSFFGRYFKSHSGMSPKEFRQTEE